ncbi:MAG: DUF5723 family protein [Bacteroidia bacterium]|nr:DUF5723 family protein [Bacteroidia bacterium]
MKLLINSLLTLCFSLSITHSNAQDEMSLFFSPRSIQQSFVQPAYYPDARVHFALPQFNIQAEHTGFRPSDLLQPIAETDSFMIDPSNALQRMSDYPFVDIRGSVEPFLLSFRVAKLQITTSARARFQTRFTYPKDLLALAWEGNANKLDQELDLAPDFSARAFQEIGVSVAIPVTSNLRVGLRAKYLGGFADLSVSQRQLNFTTEDEYYQLNLDANYMLQSSQLALGDIGNGQVEPELIVQPYSSNWGLGMDLGLTYKAENWMATASLVDYGYITWRNNATQTSFRGNLEFDGIDPVAMYKAEGDSVDFAQFGDSILNLFSIESENIDSYTTFLPSRIYAGGTYYFPWKMRLGFMGQMEFNRGNTHHAYMLSVSQDIWKFFTIGANTSFRNGYVGQFGLNALMKLGPVVLFVSSDNILPAIAPEGTRFTNFRTGMNLMFK